MATFKVPLCNVHALFHVKHTIRNTDRHDVLVVAGGRKPDEKWLRDAVQQRTVFCADKGAKYCMDNRILPHGIWGDHDSTDEEYYESAKKLGVPVQTFSSFKDDTDLQLVLAEIPAETTSLVATGIWGGRFDHLFSNVYSLQACQDRLACPTLLADEQELMVLLQDEMSVILDFVDTEQVEYVSLLPLGVTTVVSLEGVYWPLDKEVLLQTRPYAISNQLLIDDASGLHQNHLQCTCHEGKLGLYIKWKKYNEI